jgi:integrase
MANQRGKGEGSIYYNESKKVYVAQFENGVSDSGKRKRTTVTGKTKKDVIKKMRDLQHRDVAPRIRGATHNLYEYTISYLRDVKSLTVADRTLEWYGYMARHIGRYFGKTPLEKATGAMIQRFLNDLATHAKDTAIRQMKALLSQVLRQAVDDRIIPLNPIDRRIILPRSQSATTSKPTAIPRDVCKLVLDAVTASPTYRPIIILLLYTGMRIGECLGLRWSDVDFTNHLLHIEHSIIIEAQFDEDIRVVGRKLVVGPPKTETSRRTIPINQTVIDTLLAWRCHITATQIYCKAVAQGNGDYIFVTQHGAIRSYQGLRRQFGRFLCDHGLAHYKITFHRFRHTFATVMMELGVNPKIVQELLGHADIQTTLGTYTFASIAEMAKATDSLRNTLDNLE